jgi:hypothetical protein
MKAFLWCVVLAAAAQMPAAFALGRIADVEIIDRDSGVILSPHYYRGEYWVAGHPGARYAIRIRNYASGRILAVTSVDGVNVLSGEDASFEQDGYVFYPSQEYEITGWRKSRAEVAAFTFTDASSSYAGLTGRPANIGVIGVALFPERQYVPPVTSSNGLSRFAPAPSAAAKALQAPSARSQADELAGATRAPAAPTLGTGHGERESSPVEFVDFQRQDPQPAEVIRIRYDSLENLVARGIIRRPSPRRPASVPEPFPAEQAHFVPDPPG